MDSVTWILIPGLDFADQAMERHRESADVHKLWTLNPEHSTLDQAMEKHAESGDVLVPDTRILIPEFCFSILI